MSGRRKIPRLLFFTVLLLLVGACSAPPLTGGAGGPAGPSEPMPTAPVEEEPAAEEPAIALTAVLPTPSPLPTPTGSASIPLVGGGTIEAPQPAIPESRRLTLEFPPVMRTGDSMRIRMQLEVDDQGNVTPTAVVEGNVVTGEVVEIPNLYDTHYVTAEARLDMAGMEVQPPGPISEPLTPGQSVTFYWSVRPDHAGKYEGTAWLHLHFKPKAGGEDVPMLVSVQFITIEANSFMGMFSGGMARGIGTVGSILGSVLGFPFVDDLVKWLWGKLRRR